MESAQLKLRGEGSGTVGEGRRGISGSTVKLAAVAAMFIDHAAAAVLARILLAGGYVGQGQEQVLLVIYEIMRSVGRIGFPIFCFLLVEGFQRTSDVRKYALRLFIFALLSEVPFDLALFGRLTLQAQNVYFTLFLGLFFLCAFVFFQRTVLPKTAAVLFTVTGTLAPAIYFGYLTRYRFDGDPRERLKMIGLVFLVTAAVLAMYARLWGTARLQRFCGSITILMFVMYLADFMMTDYGAMGVLTIAVMYVFRKNRVLSAAAGCAVLSIMYLGELPAFLALIPVALYNGSRGLKLKYFFYAFYPVHLLLLYLIAVWMGYGGVRL